MLVPSGTSGAPLIVRNGGQNLIAGVIYGASDTMTLIDEQDEITNPETGERTNHKRYRQHSVRDFVNAAAAELGLSLNWSGRGTEETGADQRGKVIVRVDPRYFRPTEVDTLLGDSTKAREKLRWTPRTSFNDLVVEMIREDLKSAERDELVRKHGYSTPIATEN